MRDRNNHKIATPEIKSDGVLGQLWALTGIVQGLQIELAELRRWHNKAAIRAVVEEVYGDDVQRLDKLRDDVVRLLNLMIEKGILTREELNQALI